MIILVGMNLAKAEDYSPQRFNQNNDEKQKSELVLQYPELEKFLFVPPKAPIYIGLGVSPLGLVGSKYLFSVNFFQAHYISGLWDIELLSANVGKIFSSNKFGDGTHFFARMSPKINVMEFLGTGRLSIGPLVGLELVEFNQVQVKINKDVTPPGQATEETLTTTNFVNLTTFGFVYGVSLSQTFDLPKGRKLKISEMYYVQNYDLDKTRYDWQYEYANSEVEEPENFQELKSDKVIMIEFSYLF